MHKIIHLTSAHPRSDTRIFVKMCCSLAKNNYDVCLIVADGLGDELINSVQVFDVGAKSGGRLSRMTRTVNQVFEKAKLLDADIYHLHDPELIPTGLKLKSLGKKVIFDAHEDLPKQLLGKSYLNKPLRYIMSKAFEYYENWACAKFDAIVAATPFIRDKFLKINSCVEDINNFPIIKELENAGAWSEKKQEVCYIGSIARVRGVEEIVNAMPYLKDVRLNLAGSFAEEALEKDVKASEGWSRVNELGFLDRQGVKDVLARSKVGLVTLHPIINYLDALPVKMFEYMAAGIPVLASDFPLWKGIVTGSACGVCVNPKNPKEIAQAIEYLLNNPVEAEKMGEKGRQAVQNKYNWGIEEAKLVNLYEGLFHC